MLYMQWSGCESGFCLINGNNIDLHHELVVKIKKKEEPFCGKIFMYKLFTLLQATGLGTAKALKRQYIIVRGQFFKR